MSSGETYYRLETADGCLLITLLPELNDKQWADIEKVGSEIVDRLSSVPSPRCIVDLTPLSYMGSAMVALIVRLYKAVNGRNGQLVVVNQHELVFEVLKLAGLTKLWTIVENRDQAFAALGIKRRAASVDRPAGSGGNGLLAAGIIGALGAVVAFALQFSPQPLVPRKAALLIDVGFAALGMIAGTMILVNYSGARRNVGIALLAICLIAVLGGIVVSPTPAPAPPPGAASSMAPATRVTDTSAIAATNPSNAASPPSAPSVKNNAATNGTPAATTPAASTPPASTPTASTAAPPSKLKKKDK